MFKFRYDEFYRKFLINFSTVREKLNRLLDDGSKWHWTEDHEKAFNNFKELLLHSDFLVHSYPNLPIVISFDNSRYGIGAVVCHNMDGVKHLVFFISRTLSKHQRGSSKLERKTLGKMLL